MNGIKHINMDYEKKYTKDIAMTTEEKAKAYDETLERAKKCLRAAGDVGTNIVTFIFPQLAESEDERINKAIQKYLDWLTAYPIYAPRGEYSIRDMLHYLYNLERKQKEQKPIFKKGDKVIWQGEEFNILDVNGDSYNVGGYILPFHRQNELSLVEQKPAEWSEEDESQLDDIEKAISNYYDLNHAPQYHYWLEQKLKSFRPQPKAELTLLDKNIIEAAVAFVEQNDHFNCWRGIDKHTVIKALRSLKPHWKPSEEQMCYLKKVYESYDFCDGERDALEALYNDLKKLM